MPPARSAPAGPSLPVLEVEALSAGPVLRDFELVAHRGRVTALAGQVGSGASDVLRAIAGLTPEAVGRVRVDARRVRLGDPRASIDAGIGFLSADRKGEGLFLSRSIAENLVATRLPALSQAGMLAPTRVRAASARIAARVGLEAKRLREPVRRLSGGNQQKAFLGRCLDRSDIRVLLLDEPTRGVDVGGRAEIHALLREVALRGVSVVFSSSDLDEILELADEVVVMRAGSISTRLPRDETNSVRLLSDMTHAPVPVSVPEATV